MPRTRRRTDNRLLVLACVGGLVLIATPPVAYSLFGPNPVETGASAMIGEEAEPESPLALLPASPGNQDSTGRLVVLGRHRDGSVWRNYQTEAPGPSVGWHDIGCNVQGKPVVALNPDGDMSAFAIDVDGRLRQNSEVSSEFAETNTWTNLGGENLVGTPAAVLDPEGRFAVFARDAAGALWVRYQVQQGGRQWLPWRELPGPPVVGDPVVVQNGNQKLLVFALGPDGVVLTRAQAEPGANAWRSGEIPGDVATTSPAVVPDGRSRLHAFTVGADGSLQMNIETRPGSGQWRGWRSIPGPLEGKLLASTDANNTVVLFGIQRDTHHLMHLYQDLDQSIENKEKWSQWADLGGSLAELESTALDADGHLVVFGIGTNGTMAQNYQTERASGPWFGWRNSFGGGSFPPQSTSP